MNCKKNAKSRSDDELAKILEKRGWNTARFLLILKKIKRKDILKEKWCWA